MEVEGLIALSLAHVSQPFVDLAIKKRLVTDEKLIKRLVKRLQSFKKTSVLGLKNNDGDGDDNGESKQVKEALEEELKLLEINIYKQHRAARVQDLDLIHFEEDYRRLEKEILDLEEKVSRLQIQLEAVKVERAQKDQYDAIARDILKYPSRNELYRMIEEVEGETEHLSRLQADVQVNIERGATAIYDILQRLKPTKRQVEEDLKFDTNPTSG